MGFIPSDPTPSLRASFREWLLPEVFRNAVRAINTTEDGKPWLTDRQLDELRDQILRQPNRTLLQETIGIIDFWNNPAEQKHLSVRYGLAAIHVVMVDERIESRMEDRIS